MAKLKAPFALDRSLNTTEQTSRNIADVLAEELSAIITALGGLNFINYEVVEELPTTGISTTTIYLVPSDDPQSGNTYDEYINLNGTSAGWEKIGSTAIDLSGYYTSAETDALLDEKVDKDSFNEQTATDEFSTINGGLLSECKVALSPNQDLHGYSEPWVGGANVNKFPSAVAESKTASGVTVVSDGHGTYSLSGTSSADVSIDFDIEQTYTIPQSIGNGGQGCCYFFNNKTYSDGEFLFYFMDGTREIDSWSMSELNRIKSAYSAMASQTCNKVRFKINVGTNVDGLKISPMFSENGLTTNPFTWWKNICPISGHTQVDVDASDGQTTQEQVTVNLGGTYYSGVLDAVTGVFTPDTASVDLGSCTWSRTEITSGKYRYYSTEISYVVKSPKSTSEMPNIKCEGYKKKLPSQYNQAVDGITIYTNGSIQIYDSTNNTLSTTDFGTAVSGIKLVYELATPTPIQLSPTMVKALVGENHLSAPLDGQEITEVKYKKMFTFDDVIAYIQSLS